MAGAFLVVKKQEREGNIPSHRTSMKSMNEMKVMKEMNSMNEMRYIELVQKILVTDSDVKGVSL